IGRVMLSVFPHRRKSSGRPVLTCCIRQSNHIIVYLTFLNTCMKGDAICGLDFKIVIKAFGTRNESAITASSVTSPSCVNRRTGLFDTSALAFTDSGNCMSGSGGLFFLQDETNVSTAMSINKFLVEEHFIIDRLYIPKA